MRRRQGIAWRWMPSHNRGVHNGISATITGEDHKYEQKIGETDLTIKKRALKYGL